MISFARLCRLLARASTFVVVAFTLAVPVLAQDVPTVETFETPGGTTVRHVAVPDADYSSLIVFWPGNAVFRDPAKSGLFLLGTQLPLMKAGGRSSEELGEDLNDARESLVFGNSLSGTSLALTAQANDEAPFKEVAAVANAVLTDPALDPDDLEELQTEIADNLAAAEADQADIAERAVGAFISGSDPRLPAITSRPVETVAAVTVDDVRTFLDTAIHASPIVVASGPADETTIGAAVDAMLAGLPLAPDAAPLAPAPVPYEHAGQTLVVNTPISDVAIVSLPLVIRTPSPPTGVALATLAGGDGSRLFTQLREELGATYDTQVRIVPLLVDTQLASLVATVPPERAGEVVKLMRDSVAQVRTDGITDAELDAAREETLAFLDQRDADPAALSNTVLNRILREGDVPDDLFVQDRQQIANLTLDVVNAALPTVLPERVTAVIATPAPDAVQADCAVDVPEEAADCPTP